MVMVTFRHVLPLGQLVPSSEKSDSPPERHEQEETMNNAVNGERPSIVPEGEFIFI